MNIKWLLYFILFGVMMLAAAPGALGDDVLRGTLDGEERQWHVLATHGQSTSYFREDFGYVEVTLQGHAEARFATKGALSISMLAMNGQLPVEAEVMYFPEATLLPNYNSDGQEGQLELERFAVEGDQLRITGRYQGTLRYVESIRPQGESSRHMTVDVRFDLLVPREE